VVRLRSVMDECLVAPKRALAIIRQVLDATSVTRTPSGSCIAMSNRKNIMLVDGRNARRGFLISSRCFDFGDREVAGRHAPRCS